MRRAFGDEASAITVDQVTRVHEHVETENR
jgi:hypothetical protein